MYELVFVSLTFNVLLIGWIVLTYFIDFRETKIVAFLDKENNELLDALIKVKNEKQELLNEVTKLREEVKILKKAIEFGKAFKN
jgi:hypothetical protein